MHQPIHPNSASGSEERQKLSLLTLNTVRPDIPPVLRAHLLVLDQVVADGHAAVRVGLHKGDSGQTLGDG